MKNIVSCIASRVHAHSAMGPIEWHWDYNYDFNESVGIWDLDLYPTFMELYAGPEDGKVMAPAFHWDLDFIMYIFKHTEIVRLVSSAKFDDVTKPSRVYIAGELANGEKLHISLFSAPQDNAEPSMTINTNNGQIVLKEAVRKAREGKPQDDA